MTANGSTSSVTTGDATTCTIVLFNRNAQTGELTYEGIQDTQAISNPYSKLAPELVLSKDGKSLYTINGKAFHYGGTNNHDLVTYSIETDGDPDQAGHLYRGAAPTWVWTVQPR